MAMTYQNFASLGVNLNRQKYGPLDISNVFTSVADLQYYLTKGAFTEGVSEYWYKSADEKIVPYPYEGQVLATVIDGVVNVYTLALDAEGNFVTQEIAGKIEVDGTTIVKDADGKLSIVAPVDPDSSKTYNFSYANGVYSWVEVDTATAAGQAQAIASLTDRTVALETTVNGKAAVGEEGAEDYEPAVEGLVDIVASHAESITANAEAIADLQTKTEWDYVITDPSELTTENLATMRGRVLVRMGNKDWWYSSCTVPSSISWIEFKRENVTGVGAGLAYSTIKGSYNTTISGVVADGVYPEENMISLHGFGRVVNCFKQGGVLKLINCSNIDNCTFDAALNCTGITNAYINTNTLYPANGSRKPPAIVFDNCVNINNIILNIPEDGYLSDVQDESTLTPLIDFRNCKHLSNIHSTNSSTIQYENCLFVDGDTCDGYYTSEDDSKVSVIKLDGTKSVVALPENVSDLTNDAGYQTANDVATAIAGKADSATTLAGYGITDAYTKTEVDTAIDTAKKSILGEDVAQAYDTLKEIQDILEGTDGETIDGLIETVDANKQAITTLTGDVTTTGSVDKKIADAIANKANIADVVAKTDFEAFQTTNSQAIADARTNAVADVEAKGYAVETSVANRLAGKVDTATLNSYYTKSEANELLNAKADAEATTNALAGKIETAQITHTTTGVTEGVTKEGTALKIVVDAYTKAEVYTKSETDAEITKKITSINGGESAGEVKSELVDYRDALNAEIWGPAATSWTTKTEVDGKTVVTYTPKYGDSSRVDLLESAVGTDKVGETAATGLFARVATAQAKADEAAAAIVTLENGQVKTNKEDIANLLTRVGNVETQASTNKTDISTLTGTVNGINTIVEGHTATLATVNSDIIGLKAKDTEFTTILNGKSESSEGAGDAVEGLIAKVDKKANAADVYTKGDVDAKVITSGEVVRGTADSVSIADNKITVTVNSYTKGEVDNLLANLDQTELENGIKANAAAIAVLNGVTAEDATGDTGKSVRAIALEEVTKVIDGAPEALNTLKEIADWIIDDNTGSAAVVEDIAKHNAILAGFGTAEGEAATVKKYVDDAIAAIPTTPIATTDVAGSVKASDEVAVAADGKMTIAKVSTDVLAQGTDILVLDGGNASA